MSKVPAPESTESAAHEYARLLSLAAHEFRTPASVVSGYLRMLQKETDTPLSDRQRKMIDEAARSCARLVALISELSEVSKLDSNTAPVRLETFDLFRDLEEVARNVQEGDDREVTLQLGGSPAGAGITGDRHRLTAAFGSIFRALLREQPSSTTVLADRRLVPHGDRHSAVVIIAKDIDVQRAYGAVAQSFDEHRGGIGLSLPIARRVIERAGGRLWSPTPQDDADRALRSAVIISIPLPE
jgi:signal transduction histidine kinase